MAEPGARALTALRVGTLVAVAAGALALAASPALRATLQDGLSLLVQGDLPGLRAWGGRLGGWAVLGTTALMIAQAIAAPIPAVLVTFTNSWLFGPLQGGLLSIAQATLAATLCFVLARAWGEPLVSKVMSEETRARTARFVERHGAAAVLSARLVPIVPFDPISYAAGLTPMRLRTFVWATCVGQIPAGLTYSYLGQQVTRPVQLVLFGGGAFVALLVVGLSARWALVGSDADEADADEEVRPPGAPEPTGR